MALSYKKNAKTRDVFLSRRPQKGSPPPELPKWTDRGMFWLTTALFVLAAVSAAVAFWQGQIARDQLEFARKSAAESAKDTRDALAISDRVAKAAEHQALASQGVAESAAQSARTAGRSLETQQTATVAFFLADMPTIALNQKLRFSFVVKPSGQLPVANVQLATQVAIAPPDPNFALHSQLKIMPLAFSRLSPGVATGSSIESDRVMTETDMRALADGKVHIYAHGEVRYSDANGHHVTHTCSELFW